MAFKQKTIAGIAKSNEGKRTKLPDASKTRSLNESEKKASELYQRRLHNYDVRKGKLSDAGATDEQIKDVSVFPTINGKAKYDQSKQSMIDKGISEETIEASKRPSIATKYRDALGQGYFDYNYVAAKAQQTVGWKANKQAWEQYLSQKGYSNSSGGGASVFDPEGQKIHLDRNTNTTTQSPTQQVTNTENKPEGETGSDLSYDDFLASKGYKGIVGSAGSATSGVKYTNNNGSTQNVPTPTTTVSGTKGNTATGTKKKSNTSNGPFAPWYAESKNGNSSQVTQNTEETTSGAIGTSNTSTKITTENYPDYIRSMPELRSSGQYDALEINVNGTKMPNTSFSTMSDKFLVEQALPYWQDVVNNLGAQYNAFENLDDSSFLVFVNNARKGANATDEAILKAVHDPANAQEYPMWIAECRELLNEPEEKGLDDDTIFAMMLTERTSDVHLKDRYDEAQRYQRLLNEEIAYRKQINDDLSSAMSDPDWEKLSEVKSVTDDGTIRNDDGTFDIFGYMNNPKVAYILVNNPEYYDQFIRDYHEMGAGGNEAIDRTLYLNDSERRLYNYYYRTQGPDAAYKWLVELTNTDRMRGYEADMQTMNASEKSTESPLMAGASFIAARAATIGNSFLYPVQALASLIGDKQLYQQTTITNRIIGGVAQGQTAWLENANPVFKTVLPNGETLGNFVYGIAVSIADNAAQYATASALTGNSAKDILLKNLGGKERTMVEMMSLALMSSSAASQSLYQNISEHPGATQEQIYHYVWDAMIDGVIEGGTEIWSIENKFNTAGMPLVVQFLASVGFEASEEGFGDIIRLVRDTFEKNPDGIEGQIEAKLLEIGADIDHPTDEQLSQATKYVWGDIVIGCVFSMLSGGIAGGFSGGASIAAQSHNNLVTGSNIILNATGTQAETGLFSGIKNATKARHVLNTQGMGRISDMARAIQTMEKPQNVDQKTWDRLMTKWSDVGTRYGTNAATETQTETTQEAQTPATPQNHAAADVNDVLKNAPAPGTNGPSMTEQDLQDARQNFAGNQTEDATKIQQEEATQEEPVQQPEPEESNVAPNGRAVRGMKIVDPNVIKRIVGKNSIVDLRNVSSITVADNENTVAVTQNNGRTYNVPLTAESARILDSENQYALRDVATQTETENNVKQRDQMVAETRAAGQEANPVAEPRTDNSNPDAEYKGKHSNGTVVENPDEGYQGRHDKRNAEGDNANPAREPRTNNDDEYKGRHSNGTVVENPDEGYVGKHDKRSPDATDDANPAMEPGTRQSKPANEKSKVSPLKPGDKLSMRDLRDLGKIVNDTLSTIGETMKDAFTTAYDDVLKAFVNMNADDEMTDEEIQKNVGIIKETMEQLDNTGYINNKTMKKVTGSKFVSQFMADFMDQTTGKKSVSAQGVATLRDFQDQIREKNKSLYDAYDLMNNYANTLQPDEQKKLNHMTQVNISSTGDKGLTYNGAAVELKRFEQQTVRQNNVSANKTVAVLKLADGSMTTVELDDQGLSFADAGTEMLAKWLDNPTRYEDMGEKMNTMWTMYHGGNVGEYVTSFEQAYNAGFYGFAKPEFKSTKSLSKEQANIVYEQGQRDAAEYDKKRVENAGKSKGNGHVIIDESVKKANVTAEQQELIDTIMMMDGSNVPITIRLVASQRGANDMITGENGSYIDGVITLDINSGANFMDENGMLYTMVDGKKVPVVQFAIMETLGHELTHFIENNSNERYIELRNFIRDEMGEERFNSMVNHKIAEYGKQGIRLTRGGAIAEVVADSCSRMLENSKAISKLASQHSELHEEAKGFVKRFTERVKNAFKNMLNKNKQELTWAETVNAEYAIQYTEKLQKLWDASLLDATQRANEAEVKEASDAAKEDHNRLAETVNGADPNVVDTAAEDHTVASQASIRQFAESVGYDVLMNENGYAYAIIDKSTGKEVKHVTADIVNGTPMGTLIGAAVDNGTIDDKTAYKQRKMFADLMNLVIKYKDSGMVWEMAGAQMFSSMKLNSDAQYGTTIDYGTICSKTQAIVDEMSRVMVAKGRGLTREEVMDVYRATAKSGQSVPCPVCYVFSRWMGVPSLLETMRKGQNRFTTETSFAELNEYVHRMERMYPSEDKSKPGKGVTAQKAKVQGKINALQKKLQSKGVTRSNDIIAEIDRLQKELDDIELYNWVIQVYCETDNSGKNALRDRNGDVRMDPKYKPVPCSKSNNILLDLNRTGEFARDYAKAWKFRTTRGAGMGKAILPYSVASIGDSVKGTKVRYGVKDNPFLNKDSAKSSKAIKNAITRMKKQNLIGGQRFQSTSDFRAEWGIDYMMTFLEMQAIGAKVQLYTKVIEAVDMLATSGAEVNLSIMGKGKGWHVDENGNKVLDFSSITGIDFDQAYEKVQKYDNVQMILVGLNDDHIRIAMADDRIGFIIPWHSSGSSEMVLGNLMAAVNEKLENGTDYESSQTDDISNANEYWDLRKRIITGKLSTNLSDSDRAMLMNNQWLSDLYTRFYLKEGQRDVNGNVVQRTDETTYHVKLSAKQASSIFPYEYWDTNLTVDQADENGRRFREYCETMGVVGRFSQFADDNGYWKLLIDRSMYNNDGTYHEPKAINVTNIAQESIPMSVDSAVYGKHATQQQKDAAFEEAMYAIDARNNESYDMEAVPDDEVQVKSSYQMSIRDNEYMDAVDNGDMETVHDDDMEVDEKVFSLRDNPNAQVGININDSTQDFTEQILDGTKTVETRNTPSLRKYVGQRVGIVRTGKGNATVVGYATISEEIVYNTMEEFRNDFDRHLVEEGSKYDFNGKKYGYVLTDVKVEDNPYVVTEKGIVARDIDREIQDWPINTSIYPSTGVSFKPESRYSKDQITRIYEYLSAVDNKTIDFYNKHFKRSDPVTYDDAGNVIPLSERFNTENEDIRYSLRNGEDGQNAINSVTMDKDVQYLDQNQKKQFDLRQNIEQRDDGLIAIHNINKEGALRVLKSGGLVWPSIGVVKAKRGLENFGEISFVFDSSFVDPKNRARSVNTYGNDIWSPTIDLNDRQISDIDQYGRFKSEHRDKEYSGDYAGISDYMSDTWGNGNIGFADMLDSYGANKFGSIAQIQGQRDRIVSREEANKAISDINSHFDAVADSISRDALGIYSSDFVQKLKEHFIEALKRNGNKDNGYQWCYFNNSGFDQENLQDDSTYNNLFRYNGEIVYVSDENMEQLNNIVNELLTRPTQYFETKVESGVALNDVSYVVVPSTDEYSDIRKGFAEAGLQVVEYTPGTDENGRWSNGDYLQKLNSIENVQFSIREDASTVYDATEMLANLTNTDYMTGVEKLGLDAYKEQYKKYADLLAMVQEQEDRLNDEGLSQNDRIEGENRLQILKRKLSDQYQKVLKSSQGKGMTSLMKRMDSVVRQYVEGKTMKQVTQALDKMADESKELQKAIDEAVKKLSDTRRLNDITKIVSMFNQESLNTVANTLHDILGSAISQTEIKNRVAMILAAASQENSEAGAVMNLVNQLAEDMIYVTQYKGRNPDGTYDFRTREDERKFNDDAASNKATIMGIIMANKDNLAKPSITSDLMQRFRNSMNRSELTEAEAQKLLEEASKKLGIASSRLNMMWGNVTMTTTQLKQALTMQQAAEGQAEMKAAFLRNQQERLNEKMDLLKSKYTEGLIAQQEAFKERMKRDSEERKIRAHNLRAKNKFDHAVKRIDHLMRNETDYKHVPEQYKQLAASFMHTVVRHDANAANLVYSSDDAGKIVEAYDMILGSIDTDGMVYDDEMREVLINLERAIYDYTSLKHSIITDYTDGGKAIRMDGMDKLKNQSVSLEIMNKAATFVNAYIQYGNQVFINDQKQDIANVAKPFINKHSNLRNNTVWGGKIGKAFDAVAKFGGWGNMTPEYFFRMINDETMSSLNDNLHESENTYGLRLKSAQDFFKYISDKYGHNGWDEDKVYSFKTNAQGRNVELNLQQLMSLYATWKREHGQIASQHLENGGFVIIPNTGKGLLKRIESKRLTGTKINEKDFMTISGMLTDEQKSYVDDVVDYMSHDMSKLGNEASMKMFGIKKYSESYYFPIKSSNYTMYQRSDAGSQNTSDDTRLKHKSFTKSRLSNASNAVILEDFDKIAMGHVQQMITYSSFVVSLETMNRVLNYQFETSDGSKSTIRAMFQEKYGKNAADYLKRYIGDLNGGATKVERSPIDSMLSTFRKYSVAGSLSVAFQQPLSFIRAAYAINPLYLSASFSKGILKGKTYDEMMKYSGIAVIKEMGRFDASTGMTAIEYLSEGTKNEGKLKQTVNKAMNGLPEYMDAITWCQIWRAVKMETAAQNKGMDQTSEAFLQMVGNRFNEVMRTTQVYDSVLVRSQTMRNQDTMSKLMTSFMAEPTLTANMLYDACFSPASKGVRARRVGTAVGAYIVSAVLQAAVKGAMGTGRGDDDDDTWDEQFMQKFWSQFAGEINPLNLIPGYDDIVTTISGGDVTMDAWSPLQNMIKSVETFGKGIGNIGNLNSVQTVERFVEDTAGVLVQLTTNYPLRNAMRDVRAVVNSVLNKTGNASPFGGNNVSRGTSSAVMKYKSIEGLWSDDTMTAINTIAEKFGMPKLFDSSNSGYYTLMYKAVRDGDLQSYNDLYEYMTLSKITGNKNPEKDIKTNMLKALKKDLAAGGITMDKAVSLCEEYGLYSDKTDARKTLQKYLDGLNEDE